MAILRTIKCTVCGKRETEKKPNEGWKGWGEFRGIIIDGEANPTLCPDHLAKLADFVDDMVQKEKSQKET